MAWAPRIVEPDDGFELFARLDVIARSETVAVIAAPAAVAAGGELTAVINGHRVVVVNARAAAARATELAAERGAGIAMAPFDGVEAAALVESACAACGRARAGVVVRAEDAIEHVAIGNRTAIVADFGTAQMYELARRLAGSTIPVTICGPTGSGKDLVAAAIHRYSRRVDQPFVALNCSAIPDTLAEAELFGHARGAYTGAVAPRAGLIETSSGGTLFLDEVAELSPGTQARLLRVLESAEVQRVGETTTRPIDLRVIAATHRNLADEVAAGRFRKDLWYRLGVARVELAPLTQRPRDLAALIRRFTAEACERSRRPTMTLAPATARALFAHRWPGNARELRHAIEFAVAAASAGDTELLPQHLPELRGDTPKAKMRPVGGRAISTELQALERRRMVEALATCRGIQNKAAALIQMPLRSFVTKLKRYGITERDWRDS